jgi:hypothetical protein
MKNYFQNFNSTNKTYLFKYFLISISLLFMFGCGKLIYPAIWQITPINVDGNLIDWNLPLQYYDEDSKLNYSFANDESNLYICIRAVDLQTQLKMIKGGMNVWVDVAGKKNEMVGIRYPLNEKLLPNHTVEKFKKGERHDMNHYMHQMILEQSQMQLLGFRIADNGVSNLHNTSGITAALGWDSTGVLAYEVVIPTKTFYKDKLSTTDGMKTWSIGIVLNGVEAASDGEKHNDDSGSGGGGQHGGMGGGMGGGMRGGGMRGGGGRGEGGASRNALAESNTTWSYIHPTIR